MEVTKWQRICLIISLIAHSLLMFQFAYLWSSRPVMDAAPSSYIPSYVAPSESSPSPTQQTAQPQKMQKRSELIEDKNAEYTVPSETHISEMARTAQRAMRNLNQLQAVTGTNSNPEGVQLIGDKGVPKPLIKLLAKALASRLIYPPMAIDFNLRGTTLVGFTIHPNGQVSDIRLVRTSGADVLDRAALTAVNAMSPVYNVSEYLKRPEFLVVGIIYG